LKKETSMLKPKCKVCQTKNEEAHLLKVCCRWQGSWWFTPIILATQEAEIRKTKVQSQSEASNSQDPLSKKLNTKQGWQNGSSDRVSAY
jgi:hypothetical protein